MYSKVVRAAVAAAALFFSLAAHAQQQNNFWAETQGIYGVDPWMACVASVGHKATFGDWVAETQKCEGHWCNPVNGGGYCETQTITACALQYPSQGACYWASTSSNQGWEYANLASTPCTGANSVWNEFTGTCVAGHGDRANMGGCESCGDKSGAAQGNPINASMGNKFQSEVDYVGKSPFPLVFRRSYNSYSGVSKAALGPNWRSNYDSTLKIRPYGVIRNNSGVTLYVITDVNITAVRPDGQELKFTGTVDSSTNQLADNTFLTPPAFSHDRLQKIAGGYRYYTFDDKAEDYDNNGRLLSIKDRRGFSHTLAYSNGALVTIADSFGHQLGLDYDGSGRVWHLTDPAGAQTTYEYDANGMLYKITRPATGPNHVVVFRQYFYEKSGGPQLLTGIQDENGRRFATFDYYDDFRAKSTEHAGGVDKAVLTYSTDGLTTSVTDALNRTRTRSFKNVSGLMKATGTSEFCVGCGENSLARDYWDDGSIKSRTDFFNNVTNFDPADSLGRETKRTEGAGTAQERVITTSWYQDFHLPKEIDEPGRKTVFEYYDDGTGNIHTKTVTDTTTREARQTTWTYVNGLVDTVDGPRTDVSDITDYDYSSDGHQNISQIKDALGHITRIPEYDLNGNPTKIIDPNGVETDLGYDERQRLVTRTVAGATTTYEYDGVDQLTKVTLPDGSYTKYTYDDAHRLTDIEDTEANKIHYDLDPIGNRLAEKRYLHGVAVPKYVKTQVFDALGRLWKVYGKDATGNDVVATQFDYNDAQHLKTQTEAGQYVTTTHTDALGRVDKVTDAKLGETKYSYNALDQLVSVQDPKLLTTIYTLNALGDLKHLSSPDTGGTDYTYDAAGNRTSQTDARGVQVLYSFDALNRLTFIDYPGTSEDVTYAYDGANYPAPTSYGVGRLTGTTDESGTTISYYNPRGTIDHEVRNIGGSTYTTAYAYDVADRIVGITYPTNRVVTNQIDSVGRVSKITTTVGGVTSTVADSIAYMPFGPVTSYTLGNGIPVTRTFDTNYRLSEDSEASVQHFNLHYEDRRDNIAAIEDLLSSARSQTFTYDELSHLATASGSYGALTYSVGADGDRISETFNGSATAGYNYPAGSHHLDSISGATPASFTYDEVGNARSKDSLALSYNNANRLTSATNGGVTVTSIYNATAQRVKKVVGSQTTMFHYDVQGHLLAEIDSVTPIKKEYVWLGNEPIYMDAVVLRPETVVDDTDLGFSKVGTWNSDLTSPGYYGTDYLTHAAMGSRPGSVIVDDSDRNFTGTGSTANWNGTNWFPWACDGFVNAGCYGSTYTFQGFNWTGSTQSGTFHWLPALPSAGRYRVYTRWLSLYNYTSDAAYTVNYSGGSAQVHFSQRSGGGLWHLLGSYNFSATGTSVDLSGALDGNIIADAVRWDPIADATGIYTVDRATWAPPDNQTYDVYARWPSSVTNAPEATFSVQHAGGRTDVVRNEQSGGSAWNLLGTFTFSDLTTQGITLLADPDYVVAADAIRFVPAGNSVYTHEIAYFHNDHLGTPQKLTDASKQVVWEASYDPFGQVTITTHAIEQPLRFPGQYFDSETGLYQNWNRDYDPSIGRYLQSDPIGLEGGLNTYAYVSNNPLAAFDPEGLFEVVTPPGTSPESVLGRRAAQLRALGDVLKQKIEKEPNCECKNKLKQLYDNWVLFPTISDGGTRAASTLVRFEGGQSLGTSHYGGTPVGGETTFFNQTWRSADSTLPTFLHEFGHMTPGVALTPGALGFNDPNENAARGFEAEAMKAFITGTPLCH